MKKVEFYTDKRGDHRMRVKAKNGKILLISSEGYKNKGDLRKAMRAGALSILAALLGQ